MKNRALNYLKTALNNQRATFRDGQWESIEQLLNHKRVLVVQRTGWGKSMVYFLATKLLREQGAGPTLLISPLLSLMRNQLEAAERIGVKARTINSSNNDEWQQIQKDLASNLVDILLISPERLANDDFRQNILSNIANNIGLFVIDEAHCISDWGHDFRPDYRRIVRVLQAIPSNVPVLATTATANNRVMNDVKTQLGDDIELQRGTLVRRSLKLQNINIPSPAARMAWLAQNIPSLPGSGIIYTLTQRDAERVTKWLQNNAINAKAYHADIPDREDGTSIREMLEQQLLNNEIKVLVATVALGMGFDKPDLGFVIHFQRPASVVHYYQQVGRAGRAVDEAFGILLCGEEDDHIADFFIRSAFPPQQHISEIIRVLDESDNGLSVPSMQSVLNIRKSQIEKTLKFLTIESPSPISKTGSKWQVTAAASTFKFDQEYVDSITRIRRQEQQQMHEYMQHKGCLMAFLQKALDDPAPTECGKCKNCNPDHLLNETYDEALSNQAGLFLRRSYQPIEPRKQWPSNNPLPNYGFSGKISPALQASEGRALSLWRDAGWGQLVAQGKYQTNRFSDELVSACVEMLHDWMPDPAPTWVTCIPSLNNPEIVTDFTTRLASALSLPYISCIKKTRANRPQKEMENSFQQAKNLDGAFMVSLNSKMCSPCLLIDDMVDSRWTFAVASALLRQAGCTAVYPMALALNSPRMD
ncbi:MAG TPA: ATP-dependent DNA helicase RecG [Fibrobacteres bacterium]|nr:ATP-dependent DNA helicase RecG [Fibrobacterota bacterium]